MIARLLLAPLLCLLLAGATLADNRSADEEKASNDEAYAAYVQKVTTPGPAQVAVRDQALLDLPEGFAFVPEKPARDFMKRLGNITDDNFVGVVISTRPADWFVIVEYIPAGYVKDDDAKDWKADDLLSSIRDNTEKDNAERRKTKTSELEVLGWIEEPHYDAANHRLIWSIKVRDKGAPASADAVVNYRTLALGREGYVSMGLVTASGMIEAQKPLAKELLAHLTFNKGKGYGDFNASTDRVAEYGLAALIGAVAVKKLGLFAVIAAFVAKGAKFIAVAALGLLAWFRRLFGRRREERTDAAAAQGDLRHGPPGSS